PSQGRWHPRWPTSPTPCLPLHRRRRRPRSFRSNHHVELALSNTGNTMKLYGFSPSPNTWKVRALAAHLGIPLDYEFVDLTKGASRTPAYLAINPTGRTPALVDGDFKLWESVAIMQYLAAQRPNSLWPDDARARADIMRWQSWQLVHWGKES